jgi:two-component sensor histidine kinase
MGCTAAASLIRLALGPLLGDSVPFITFYPAVVVASVWGGALAGVVTLFLGSCVAVYAWFPPLPSIDFGASWWGVRIAVFWLGGGLLIIIAALLRALVYALIASEQQANLLAYETQHRARNVLGLVQAISRQTFRSACTPAEYQSIFEARLAALGRAQDLAVEQPQSAPNLVTLLNDILEPFGTERFSLDGPEFGVPHDLCLALALVVHELGTNALKYGALSVPDGSVTIDWVAAEPRQIRLRWRERNGPPVVVPPRAGFGSRLVQTAFPPGRGTASLAFEPDGVACTIYVPTI